MLEIIQQELDDIKKSTLSIKNILKPLRKQNKLNKEKISEIEKKIITFNSPLFLLKPVSKITVDDDLSSLSLIIFLLALDLIFFLLL